MTTISQIYESETFDIYVYNTDNVESYSYYDKTMKSLHEMQVQDRYTLNDGGSTKLIIRGFLPGKRSHILFLPCYGAYKNSENFTFDNVVLKPRIELKPPANTKIFTSIFKPDQYWKSPMWAPECGVGTPLDFAFREPERPVDKEPDCDCFYIDVAAPFETFKEFKARHPEVSLIRAIEEHKWKYCKKMRNCLGWANNEKEPSSLEKLTKLIEQHTKNVCPMTKESIPKNQPMSKSGRSDYCPCWDLNIKGCPIETQSQYIARHPNRPFNSIYISGKHRWTICSKRINGRDEMPTVNDYCSCWNADYDAETLEKNPVESWKDYKKRCNHDTIDMYCSGWHRWELCGHRN